VTRDWRRENWNSDLWFAEEEQAALPRVTARTQRFLQGASLEELNLISFLKTSRRHAFPYSLVSEIILYYKPERTSLSVRKI
jgi:hypothetical protein